MSTGSISNPLRAIIDLLILYSRILVQVHQASTDVARRKALDGWHRCHPAIWGSSSSRNDTVRMLADPAKAWLTRANSRYVEVKDFDLVEECVSRFQLSRSAPSRCLCRISTQPRTPQMRNSGKGGLGRVTASFRLDNLIARLKELGARAGEVWTPALPLQHGCAHNSTQSGKVTSEHRHMIPRRRRGNPIGRLRTNPRR